jgi:transposase
LELKKQGISPERAASMIGVPRETLVGWFSAWSGFGFEGLARLQSKSRKARRAK